MTYTVKFQVVREGKPRTITVDFAGCDDEPHALRKVAAQYTGIQKILSATLKKGKGE